MEFIDAVKKVRVLKPEQILTGHEDIRGEAPIQQALTRIIDSAQWVHDQTVKGMNDGVPLPVLMQSIKTPDLLTLSEEHGKVAWNVRAIWHEYSGWYDPSRGITELYGVRENSIAPALVELVGEEVLIARARAFVRQAQPLEALQMLAIVQCSNPDSGTAKDARREALQTLASLTDGSNLWERMSINAELKALDD